jgi:hypothetical protein
MGLVPCMALAVLAAGLCGAVLAATGSLTAVERQSLVDFYTSSGPNSADWAYGDASSDPCDSWVGVVCYNTDDDGVTMTVGYVCSGCGTAAACASALALQHWQCQW